MIRVAAAAAILVHRGHVLLARRRNPPDAGLWGYPGGHREAGEDLRRTAIRELREETGVRAIPSHLVAVLPVGRFRLALVACRHVSGVPRPADDVDRAAWFPIGTVLARDLPVSRHVDTALARALLSRRTARPPCCGTSPTWR